MTTIQSQAQLDADSVAAIEDAIEQYFQGVRSDELEQVPALIGQWLMGDDCAAHPLWRRHPELRALYARLVARTRPH